MARKTVPGRRPNYVVVTRDKKLPIEYFITPETAANYIYEHRRFSEWVVLAQDVASNRPFRQLLPNEKEKVDQRLYPGLYSIVS